MHDPNRTLKWLLVVSLVAISIVVLYPPDRTLKGGIDLVGGSSLLFEIDTTGLEKADQHELSTRIMRILKDRVDPQSQLNLEWRPVGNTRIEIRMPRPPQAAVARREAKEAAIQRIQSMNLTRFEVESVLDSAPDQRAAAFASVQKGVESREPLIAAVAAAAQSHREAKEKGETAAIDAASEGYEKAMSELLATSLPIGRLMDILALPKGDKRAKELAKLREQYAAYDRDTSEKPCGAICQAQEAYDAWASVKSDLEDPSDLKRRLRGAGVLEFRILADRDPEAPDRTKHAAPGLQQSISKYTEQLAKWGPRPKSGDRYQWHRVDDVAKFLRLTDLEQFEAVKSLPGRPIVEEYAGRYYALAHGDPEFGMVRTSTGKKWQLRGARGDRDPWTGENVVNFTLNARGGQLFRELTGKNVGRQLCIFLDDSAMSHATINEAIGEHCQISGGFTVERVQDLVNTLEAGSLPARLKETPLSEQTIGPSLGETNRLNGLKASLWGLVLVVLFVVFYYGIAGGGVTTVALALNLLFTLAIMAMMQATFTLPGIAGLLLSIGMAIDANVLIFERIREERNRGVPFKKALTLGYDKAFSAILDGNLTTLITSVILGYVGSEEIKGFAITLGIGIAMSMFTALTVTRLFYTTLVSKNLLNDFSMRRLIGVPKIDWVGLRRFFWPASTAAVAVGLGLFGYLSARHTETFFDIEFLGGTSVQIDLKPQSHMTDEELRQAITNESTGSKSAANWLVQAARQLESAAAQATEADAPGKFRLESAELTGDQLAALTRMSLEDKLERNGIVTSGGAATYESRGGSPLTLDGFKAAVRQAASRVADAGQRLRGARIQEVGKDSTDAAAGPSYEIATTETNRPVVQAAILAALGDRLAVQRAISFNLVSDAELTREPFFVIEGEDQYLSDVIDTTANYDIRAFRGGVAVDIRLPAAEAPLGKEELERRLRQVSLQPEFEQFRTAELAVFPLDESERMADGQMGNRRFAVCGHDESLHYDDDTIRWTDNLARPYTAQIEAALGSERSLSKVVQFAPQIAGQTQNRAVFALILAMLGIGAYVWFRFGTRDYGLAVLVTVVHDVCVVLGLIAASHWIGGTLLGRGLLIEDFRFDLTMLAAILTIIGYQLNDTIVVFDRIRENRGRAGALSAALVNASINDTMSRTILTATLVSLTVIVLYLFGGPGIHGFAFAMLSGTLIGTYSTIAVAVPLVHRPLILRCVTWIIVAIGLIGTIFALVDHATLRWILAAVAAAVCLWALLKTTRGVSLGAGQPVAA
jgi:SecD/SecF fusion protein